MNHLVTDELAKRVAIVMLESHPEGIDEWQASTDEMQETFYRSVRAGLEYFMQVLGEPVAYIGRNALDDLAHTGEEHCYSAEFKLPHDIPLYAPTHNPT